MSWCTKFHCIISKKRYLIVYGNHIRPKRSRLRRCDPAVQLLTHGYTDTAKAANQRRQNGPSAKLQYVLRQIPILHQLITQAYESSAAANAQKVFEGWLCECRTASSIASQNWIILLTHTQINLHIICMCIYIYNIYIDVIFTSISSIPSTSLLQQQLSAALRTFAARLAALPSWHINSVWSKGL